MNNNVKKVYSILNAKWYDGFKYVWNKLVCQKAEKRFSEFLKKNVNPHANILDLGCGTALNLEKIESLGLRFKNYKGWDFSPHMLAIARKKFQNRQNISFEEKDIANLNGIKEKFDVIICTWVLSHLEHPENLVNQAQRLLDKNGEMFFIFFSRPKWYMRFFLKPLARLVLRANYVMPDKVQKFKNVKIKHSYSANIITTIEI